MKKLFAVILVYVALLLDCRAANPQADVKYTTDVDANGKKINNLNTWGMGLITSGAVILRHDFVNTKTYPAANDTNAARGAALLAALADATAGDSLTLTVGIFTLTVGIALPNDVSISGAGMDATEIDSTVGAPTDPTFVTAAIMKPGNNSQITDLTIRGTAASGVYQFPLGAALGQAAFTNAVARNVRLIGDSDGTYWNTSGTCNLKMINCRTEAKFDGVNILSAGTLETYNCDVTVTGPSTMSGPPPVPARGVAAITGKIIWHGGRITVSGSAYRNLGFSAVNPLGIEISGDCVTDVSGALAADVESSGNRARISSLSRADGAALVVVNASDVATTYTHLSRFASRDLNLGDLPDPAAARANLGITGSNVLVGRTLRVDVVNGNDTTALASATGHNNGLPFLTLPAAVSAAATAISGGSPGEFINLGPGTVDLVAAQVVLPNNVSLNGSGFSTRIISTLGHATATNSAIVVPGNNSKVSNLTIEGTAASGVKQLTFGSGDTDQAATNVILSGVRLVSDHRAMYVGSLASTSSYKVYDSIMEAKEIGVEIVASGTIDIYGTSVTVAGPSTVSGSTQSIGLHSASSTSLIQWFGGLITVSGGTVDNFGAYCNANGKIAMLGATRLNVSGTGAFDLRRQSGQLAILPNISRADNAALVTSGTILKIETPRPAQRVGTATDATSITPDSDAYDVVKQANTQAVGTLTVNAPTGTPTDGQRLILRIKCTNAQTFSWNSIYRGGTSFALPTTSTSAKTDYVRFFYNATDTKWDMDEVHLGY